MLFFRHRCLRQNDGSCSIAGICYCLLYTSTGGRWYISTVNAFHGKSMGAISLGGKGSYREDFIPMIQQVQHVEYGNADATRAAVANLTAVGEKVAAIIVEPIQGEGGVIIPPDGYLKELRAIADEYGICLIFDEIQTGMGRTGTMWRADSVSYTHLSQPKG